MTRDIFDPAFGTLDLIVAAVLRHLNIPATLSIWSEGAPGVTTDALAERNAHRFIEYFGDRKIAAIKAVREVTGLSLRDAKDAVEQVFETYDNRVERQFTVEIAFADHGEGLQNMSLNDVLRLIDDQMSGDLGDGLLCTSINISREW